MIAMKRTALILAIAATGTLFTACSNETETQQDTVANDTFATEPAATTTPGQQLDAAIENTEAGAAQLNQNMKEGAAETKQDLKEAGQKTKETFENAYDKTKAGVKEAGRDVKEAAQTTRDKTKEAGAKAAEKTEQKSRELKEDLSK